MILYNLLRDAREGGRPSPNISTGGWSPALAGVTLDGWGG